MIQKKYKGAVQGILLILIVAFGIWRIGLFRPKSPAIDCDWDERLPVAQLQYVEHARCRMACRNIDQALVEDVYLNGTVNCHKSSVKDGHRRYALEKRDDKGDMIRIIVEDEDDRHLIITVIRLDVEDRCSCS